MPGQVRYRPNECEGGGGPDRDRTGDLLNAIQARSQLRYRPTNRQRSIPHPADESQPTSRPSPVDSACNCDSPSRDAAWCSARVKASEAS